MLEKIKHAFFYPDKKTCAGLLAASQKGEPKAFDVEKVVFLNPEDFEKFKEDMTPEYPFIKDGAGLMGIDQEHRYSPILVACEQAKDGILLCQHGSTLYSAYVANTDWIDLSGKPAVNLPLKEPKAYQEKAAFFRRAANAGALMDAPPERLDSFCVEQVVVLTDAEYQEFKDGGLLQDQIYIFDNHNQTYFDPGEHCWHCLLVKGETGKDGVLVEAGGRSYASYAAFAPDCGRLRLKDVPVHYEPPAVPPKPLRLFGPQPFTIHNSPQGYRDAMESAFEITAVYELSRSDFTRFAKSPSLKAAFVSHEEYRKGIGMGPVDYLRCALLVCETDNRGLLVSTGCPGDVITAPLIDHQKLDLSDVPRQPLFVTALKPEKAGPSKNKSREPIR